jgi:hypothetical protein
MTEHGLPEIPVIDVTGDVPALGIAEAAEDRLEELFEAAHAHYGRRVVAVADRLSQRWTMRNATPYQQEIAAFADRMPVPGGWFANASFEWSCTNGVQLCPDTGLPRMLRVLDWPLAGLGRCLVAARQKGPAGDFLNLTWPGFIGAATAISKGRFAAALNQAPARIGRLTRWGDFAASHIATWRSREIPPMHLLRQVFERCGSFGEAKHALTHTPIAVSAIYTLVGTCQDETCVIERLPEEARVLNGPTAIANHWQSPESRGRPRTRTSHSRERHMQTLLAAGRVDAPFDWLTPPILNPDTRLAAVLDASSGQVTVQGFESDGPATRPLSIDL